MGREPGEWAAARAGEEQRRFFALMTLLCVLTAGIIVVAVTGAGAAPGGLVVAGALLLAVLFLRARIERRLDAFARWHTGAASERLVGRELDALRAHGYVVAHDLDDREGNLDHFVAGPTGVFLVETKSRRYEEEHLVKVKRQSAKVARELGVWVAPVICVAARDGRWYRDRGVWIVPPTRIAAWIRGARGAPADPGRIDEFRRGR